MEENGVGLAKQHVTARWERKTRTGLEPSGLSEGRQTKKKIKGTIGWGGAKLDRTGWKIYGSSVFHIGIEGEG